MHKEKIKSLHHLADIGKMSLGVYHDLINPLNSLILHLNEINKKNLNLKLKSNINSALNAILTMEELILSANAYYLNNINKYFNAKNEILKIINILNYKIKKNNIKILYKANNNIYIKGPVSSFNRIVLNLLNNSIDACLKTKKRNKRIQIKFSKNKGFLILKIIDNGCGISEKDSKKLFEPFYSTKSVNNFGLGLNICQELIKKDYFGKIIYYIEKKKTIFQIEIPCKNR